MRRTRVPKRNYGHEKRQRETARRVRQQKKLERRQTRGPLKEPQGDAGSPHEPGTEEAP